MVEDEVDASSHLAGRVDIDRGDIDAEFGATGLLVDLVLPAKSLKLAADFAHLLRERKKRYYVFWLSLMLESLYDSLGC